MAQRYEYQDIDGHVILLFVHPAEILEGEGYRQTQYWLNIYIGDAQRSV